MIVVLTANFFFPNYVPSFMNLMLDRVASLHGNATSTIFILSIMLHPTVARFTPVYHSLSVVVLKEKPAFLFLFF